MYIFDRTFNELSLIYSWSFSSYYSTFLSLIHFPNYKETILFNFNVSNSTSSRVGSGRTSYSSVPNIKNIVVVCVPLFIFRIGEIL